MTLFTFDQEEHGVTVVMDTLTCTPQHAPAGYRNKVWTFPHLDMIMAVTGTAEVGEVWFNRINRLEHVLDIEELNTIAPGELNEIRSSLTQMLEQDIGSSTVYMFGFPQDSDELVRYIYRSRRDFTSERSQEKVFAVKPQPKTIAAAAPESFGQWIDLAHRVREENGDGSAPNTVPIGGELFATTLRKGAIITQRIHRFADYDETTAQIRSSEAVAVTRP